MVEPMVEIKHLCKRFGSITAVDDVSFRVERGEVLGFLGPNGAGKSTTMKMITGFLAPDSGSVAVGGDDIAKAPIAVKRRIGYLPEGAPLYADMTARAFLRFIAEIRGFRGEERERRIAATVAKVQLEQVLDQPIGTLSKGFKRRVGLAQAIMHDPEVLILDEPTDGLDPNQKHQVRALIRDMAHTKAIVLSTHILEEVEAVCTRALIIARGRIVCDGTPAELEGRSRMHNAVTLALRGASANGTRDDLRALSGVDAVEVLGETDGLVRFQLYPHNGASLVTVVSEAARTHGWKIEELTVARGRLDEVFRALTTGAAVQEQVP
jgi:ABC-2 type transport system ATP-binding protein